MDFQKVALPELSPQQMPEPELEQLAEKQMDHWSRWLSERMSRVL